MLTFSSPGLFRNNGHWFHSITDMQHHTILFLEWFILKPHGQRMGTTMTTFYVLGGTQILKTLIINSNSVISTVHFKENLNEYQTFSLVHFQTSLSQILRKPYPFLVFHTASVPTHPQFCLVPTSRAQVLVLERQWCVAKLRHLPDSQVTLQLV